MLICDEYAKLTEPGWLYLDLRQYLQTELLIAPWAKGLQLFYRNADDDSDWQPLVHEDPDIILISEDAAINQMQGFLTPIPDIVQKQIMPFTYRQFTMLRWIAILKEAQPFFIQHPILFWLIVDLAYHEKWNTETMRQHLNQPVQNLLELAVGCSSRATQNLLKKIKLIKGDRFELELLRRVIRTAPVDQIYRHQKTVNALSLRIIERYPDLSQTGILRYLDVQIKDHSLPHALTQAEKAHRILERINTIHTLFEIKDKHHKASKCKNLDELHDYYIAAMQRIYYDQEKLQKYLQHLLNTSVTHEDAKDTSTLSNENIHNIPSFIKNMVPNPVSDLTFPEPHIRSSETIIAIRNAAELAEEECIMGNGVLSYLSKIIFGKYYIYRILAPSRETLILRVEETKPMAIIRKNIAPKKIITSKTLLPRNFHTYKSVGSKVYRWLEKND